MTPPVTNETGLLRDQIETLEKLQATPTLTLSVSGGGMPEPQSLMPNNALVISRDDVGCILNRLRGALALREEQGW